MSAKTYCIKIIYPDILAQNPEEIKVAIYRLAAHFTWDLMSDVVILQA